MKQRPKGRSEGLLEAREKTPIPAQSQNGLVSFCIHGPSGKIAAKDFTASKMIKLVQAGLAVQELIELQTSLDIPMERLAPMLGISKATLHRRKGHGRLGREESDRVLRYARLMGKAVEVFESKEKARHWTFRRSISDSSGSPASVTARPDCIRS